MTLKCSDQDDESPYFSIADKPKHILMGRKELLDFAGIEIGFYDPELNRISTLLLAQLFQLWKNRIINIDNVILEIKALEGNNHKIYTKKESAFNKNTPLYGFYYKHFTDPQFLLNNFIAEFGYHDSGNKRLDNVIGRLFHEHKGEYIDQKFMANLAHQTSIGAWERRTKNDDLTGEWIIIGKHLGKRYYLCLAAHSETNGQILKRIQDACAIDFKFIPIGV